MVWPLAIEKPDQHCDDEVGYEHTNPSAKEELSTSKLIHTPKTPQTSNYLTDIEDTGHSQLHLVVKTHGGEERRRVVDESVDADKLSRVRWL